MEKFNKISNIVANLAIFCIGGTFMLYIKDTHEMLEKMENNRE